MKTSQFPSKLFSSFNALASITVLLFFFFTISLTKPCLATRLLQHHSDHNNDNNDFIKSSCGVTLYPKVCYKALIGYASSIQTSPMEMAVAALNVSLKSAQSTSKTVLNLSRGHGLKPSEAGAVRDCVETMGDSVDELKQSLVAMEGLDGPDFEFKIGNIQTWVSAALTNEDTCMDGFEGKAKNLDETVKGIIRSCIVKVAQLTSISLAIINKLSST